MIYNQDKTKNALNRNENNEDLNDMLHLKKKMTLGLRLGRHKAHAHLKQAEEELAQMHTVPVTNNDYEM